nr:MAG TPA: hypothetical protein [Caudoviricetes sp.]
MLISNASAILHILGQERYFTFPLFKSEKKLRLTPDILDN